jgi:hypothetical protein
MAPAERDVAADDLVGLQLEIRDGLAGLGEHGLLAGDQVHVALGVGDHVLVGLGIDAGVEVIFRSFGTSCLFL